MDPATLAAATEIINKVTGLSVAGVLLLAGWLSYKGIWTWGTQVTELRERLALAEANCKLQIEKIEARESRWQNTALAALGVAETTVHTLKEKA